MQASVHAYLSLHQAPSNPPSPPLMVQTATRHLGTYIYEEEAAVAMAFNTGQAMESESVSFPPVDVIASSEPVCLDPRPRPASSVLGSWTFKRYISTQSLELQHCSNQQLFLWNIYECAFTSRCRPCLGSVGITVLASRVTMPIAASRPPRSPSVP